MVTYPADRLILQKSDSEGMVSGPTASFDFTSCGLTLFFFCKSMMGIPTLHEDEMRERLGKILD